MFDLFGDANQETHTAPAPDPAGNSALGGIGTVLGHLGFLGAAGGKALGYGGVETGGEGMGVVGDTMQAISELRNGQYGAAAGDGGAALADVAAMAGPESMGGPLGIVGGVAQALGHGYEASKHVDEIDAGYQNNQFWDQTGQATLGGANAIASALGPEAELYVGGTELALDAAGAVSGLAGSAINGLGHLTGAWDTHIDSGFNAGSAVGGVEHALFDSGQALAAGGSWLYDHL